MIGQAPVASPLRWTRTSARVVATDPNARTMVADVDGSFDRDGRWNPATRRMTVQPSRLALPFEGADGWAYEWSDGVAVWVDASEPQLPSNVHTLRYQLIGQAAQNAAPARGEGGDFGGGGASSSWDADAPQAGRGIGRVPGPPRSGSGSSFWRDVSSAVVAGLVLDWLLHDRRR